MAKKNPDEEAAIKRAQKIAEQEAATERRINELNREKDMKAEEKLRRLLDEDE
jgi:hypothetical protein